jgi:hypothetical protein
MQGKKKIIMNLFTKNLIRDFVYSLLRRISLKFLKITLLVECRVQDLGLSGNEFKRKNLVS